VVVREQEALPQPRADGAAVPRLPRDICHGGAALSAVGLAFSDQRKSSSADTLADIAFTKLNLD